MAAKNIRLNITDFVPAAEWAGASAAVRRAAIANLGSLALGEKQREIRLGIGVDGKQLKPVKPESRPDGATGKPLDPHYAESRSIRLLAVHVDDKGITLFWRADGSRGSWSKILGYHADGLVPGAPVRNIIGFSPKGMKRLKDRFGSYWRNIHKAKTVKVGTTRSKATKAKGKVVPPPPPPPPPPAPAPTPAPKNRGRVVYLKPGEKPKTRGTRKIQVYEVPERGKGKGKAPKPVPPPPPPPAPTPKPKPVPAPKPSKPAPKVSPKPAPKPKPVVVPPAPKVVVSKPVPVPKAVQVVKASKPATGEKIPPKPKTKAASASPKAPQSFEAEMRARVDRELKRIDTELTQASQAVTRATEHFNKVRFTAQDPEARAAKLAAEGAHIDLVDRRERFERWQSDVQGNPNLIPPFEIQERLRIYAERGGREKLEAIKALKARLESPAAIAERSNELAANVARATQLREELRVMSYADPKRQAIEDELYQTNLRRLDLEGKSEASTIARAQAVAEAIAAAKPMRLEQAAAPTQSKTLTVAAVPPQLQAQVDTGLGWLRRVLADGGEGGLSIPIGLNRNRQLQRSHASDDGLALEGTTHAATVIHEVGHFLDSRSGSGRSAGEFLAYRVGDEPFAQLSQLFPGHHYMDWEKGRKDRFDEAFGRRAAYYVGKPYNEDEHSSEVTSMGVEQLYANPFGFVERDPEYASFILGLLDGSLR